MILGENLYVFLQTALEIVKHTSRYGKMVSKKS